MKFFIIFSVQYSLYFTTHLFHSDAKDTIPIPEDGSTKFVNFKFEGDTTPWLDYASERKGRFVGLENKDGSTKTECGIHVAGAEQAFDRVLWEEGKVHSLASNDEASEIMKGDKEAIVVVYAPWCQFCQGMEDELTKYAESAGVPVYKFLGDANVTLSKRILIRRVPHCQFHQE